MQNGLLFSCLHYWLRIQFFFRYTKLVTTLPSAFSFQNLFPIVSSPVLVIMVSCFKNILLALSGVSGRNGGKCMCSMCHMELEFPLT